MYLQVKTISSGFLNESDSKHLMVTALNLMHLHYLDLPAFLTNVINYLEKTKDIHLFIT